MDIKLDTKKFGEIIFKIDESDYKKFVQNRKIYVSKMCNDKAIHSKNTEKRKFKGEDIFEILISPLSNKKLALKFNCSSCLISKIRTGILYDKFFPEILRSENIKRRQNVYRI